MIGTKTRKIEYDDRIAVQQADQAIRKDLVRALVEIITNANDSYQRMEEQGLEVDGRIIIDIQRKFKDSVIRIRDYAEGMDSDTMDKAVGTYGSETSGFTKGKSVRGLWGRGLKDSIFGLGHGKVYSFKDGQFYQCALFIQSGTPKFSLNKAQKANRELRKQFEFSTQSGTIIEIVKSRDDIKTPQFDSIRKNLERHFELRTINGNPKRKVLLREVDGKGKAKEEAQIVYKTPVGKTIFDEIIDLPQFATKFHLEVNKSEVPLSTPSESGPTADGGFLIISKGVVLALTLFKFENNEYASRLYGIVSCDHLHDLLKKNPPEPILSATRDGINWDLEFTNALKKIVEEKLEPLIAEEKNRLKAEEQQNINKKLKERLNIALKELNSIASRELGKIGDADGTGEISKIPVVPPGGFGFVPDYAYIQSGVAGSLTLRGIIPEKVNEGNLISIESDNSEVTIISTEVLIRRKEGFPNIGEAKVVIEGRQVGAEAVITATFESIRAEAFVKVVSKKITTTIEPATPRSKGSLIKGFRFDKTGEPRQRVRFDRATSEVVISTRAPSVAVYF